MPTTWRNYQITRATQERRNAVIVVKFADGVSLPLYDAEFDDAANEKLANYVSQLGRKRIAEGKSDCIEICITQEVVNMRKVAIDILTVESLPNCA
jgi:hypothetical protein